MAAKQIGELPETGLEEAPPHYHGHRERLRGRFREAGADAVSDYELLELVLFRALPRRDVKPLAKALIEKFGSFAEVIAAPPQRLAEVAGLGNSAITEFKIVEAAARTARARRGEEAPPARLVVRGPRILPRRHGVRRQGAVPERERRQILSRDNNCLDDIRSSNSNSSFATATDGARKLMPGNPGAGSRARGHHFERPTSRARRAGSAQSTPLPLPPRPPRSSPRRPRRRCARS